MIHKIQGHTRNFCPLSIYSLFQFAIAGLKADITIPPLCIGWLCDQTLCEAAVTPQCCFGTQVGSSRPFAPWASPPCCGGCAAVLATAWQTFSWMTGAGRRLAVSGSSPDTRAVCCALITLMWGLGHVVLCSEEGCEAGTESELHYRGNAGTAAPRRIHNL